MDFLEQMCNNAKQASKYVMKLSAKEKNDILMLAGQSLFTSLADILEANEIDIDNAKLQNMKPAFIDRLKLTRERIISMAEGLFQISKLEDPVGIVDNFHQAENGLVIGKKTVPIGVVCMIYEARPNVTCDAFGIALKAGNSIILRGGSEAINSNKAIVRAIRDKLQANNININIIQIIPDTSRECIEALFKMNKYIDVLIPRGGANLIKNVVENCRIPIIETGLGNCHIYVDETANLDMALEIIINAKTQRPGVCNACEKVLVHENIKQTFLVELCNILKEHEVEIRGDISVCMEIENAIMAEDEDWGTEYSDLIICIGIVKNVDEAIEHINNYSTKHSETIVTENYSNSQQFLNEIDSAVVYVNASTRFTDGSEFGFGAEIGISTQKLHARGPMGVKQLTSYKYVVFGNGQVR